MSDYRPLSERRLATGQATINRLWGIEYPTGHNVGEPAVVQELNELRVEHAFTDSWSRPGLDDRTRIIMTIAFDIALGTRRQLREHVSGALVLGITREEIIELLIHSIPYCGIPAADQALSIIREYFGRSDAVR